MTDPRIEAAAWMIGSVSDLAPGGDWEKLTPYQKTHFRRLAKAVMESADDAACRTIESAPEEETIIIGDPEYSEQGRKSAVSAAPEWDGLFFSDTNPSEPISPQPTHWQPLPSPPAVDVGGGNG